MAIKLIVTAAVDGGDRQSRRVSLEEGNGLTLGQLGVSANDPAGKPLVSNFPLIRIKEDKVVITLPAGVKGTVAGKELDELRASGTLKQQNTVEIMLLGVDPVEAQIGDARIRVQREDAAETTTTPVRQTAAANKPVSTTSRQPAKLGDSGETPPSMRRKDDLDSGNWQATKRQSLFLLCLIFALGSHAGAITYLAMMDVPDEYYSDPTKIPDRFVKLFVKEVEKEPEDTGSGSSNAAPTEVAEAEEAGDEGGGGDESKETAAPQERSREQMKDKVRSKGVLALITSKGGGGAIGDVLSSGAGLAGDLDAALKQVSGVGVAGPGVEIRGQRGGGGAGKADIGALAAGSGRAGGLGTKKQKTIEARIEADQFETSGSLSQEAIRSIVQKELAKIKYCYNKELGKNPDLKGKVEVEFVIDSEGMVKTFKIRSSTMKNDAVESCMLLKIRRFKFPKPDKGEVTVVYPFVFTTAG